MSLSCLIAFTHEKYSKIACLCLLSLLSSPPSCCVLTNENAYSTTYPIPHSVEMDASQQTSLDSGRDQNSGKDPKDRKMGLEDDNELGIATTIEKGEQKYNRLGWKRLTICMIV